MREDGLRIDRLLLTTDTTFIPTDTGPAESNPVEGGMAFLIPASEEQTLLAGVQRNRGAGEQGNNLLANSSTHHSPFPASPFAQNPVLMILMPLAVAGPLARKRRWRRYAWLIAILLFILIVATTGIALATTDAYQIPDAERHPSAIIQQPSILTIDHRQPTTNNGRWTTDHRLPTTDPLLLTPHSLLPDSTGTITTTYTYDSLYRLTDATSQSDNQLPPSANYYYTYDAAGNRTTYTVNSTQVATYTYDAANRLTQVNSQAYTYDDNGNLLDDGQFSYSYDSANRLTQLSDGLSTVDYEYNGDGVRVAQIVDGLRTDYVQDVAALLPQVLTARQGGTTSRYLRGLGLIGEQRAGSGPAAGPPVWQYHLPDALGSVRQVSDPGGQVLLSQRYDPYGGLESANGIAQSHFAFAGEEQDPAGGHLFLRARSYNPETGRFLQQDPVMGTPNEPRTLHPYAYAFNNPVNFVDPSGNMPPVQTQSYSVSSGSVRPAGNYNRSIAGTQHGGTGGYTVARRGYTIRPYFSANGGSSSSNRSVNAGGSRAVQRTSNLYSRAQSQGHRPIYCGRQGPSSGASSPLDLLLGLRDAGRGLFDKGESILNNPLDTAIDLVWDTLNWTDTLRDRLKGLPSDLRNMTWEQAVTDFNRDRQSGLGLALSVGVGALPFIGSLYDAASLGAGVDLITGIELTSTDQAIITAGLGLGILGGLSFLDEVAEISAKMVRNLDNLDAVRMVKAGKGVSRLDEMVDVGRRLKDNILKRIPDLDTLKSFKSLDEATTASRLRNLDNFTGGNRAVSRGDDLRRSLGASSDSGALSRRLDDIGEVCGINSFTAGTMVHTDEGEKPIEEVAIGDKVLTEDPETGEQGYFEVVALTNHPKDEILAVTLDTGENEPGSRGAGEQGNNSLDSDGDTLDNNNTQLNSDDTQSKTENLAKGTHAKSKMEVTPEHPVYIEGKGWIWAENLSIGDRLRRSDGGMARVLAIERVALDEAQPVYNFTVKGPHTYFVLEAGVLVHNQNPVCRPGLENRTQADFWKKGQLTDEEFEFLQQLAKDRNKKIVLSGSLAETERGLANRANPQLQKYLPDWRKSNSELVQTGKVQDIDFWEGSELTSEEIAQIRKIFPEAEIDATGYALRNYPNETSFSIQGGAIVFYPGGRTVRRAAPWREQIGQGVEQL